MKITQHKLNPFKEVELKQAMKGNSIYLTTTLGQKFRVDEDTDGGLVIKAWPERAVNVVPQSFNGVMIERREA